MVCDEWLQEAALFTNRTDRFQVPELDVPRIANSRRETGPSELDSAQNERTASMHLLTHANEFRQLVDFGFKNSCLISMIQCDSTYVLKVTDKL